MISLIFILLLFLFMVSPNAWGKYAAKCFSVCLLFDAAGACRFIRAFMAHAAACCSWRLMRKLKIVQLLAIKPKERPERGDSALRTEDLNTLFPWLNVMWHSTFDVQHSLSGKIWTEIDESYHTAHVRLCLTAQSYVKNSRAWILDGWWIRSCIELLKNKVHINVRDRSTHALCRTCSVLHVTWQVLCGRYCDRTVMVTWCE